MYIANTTIVPFMYQVLDKDIIKESILPHLSTAKREFTNKSCLIEVVNSTLYKLKTGWQWCILDIDAISQQMAFTILKNETVLKALLFDQDFQSA